MKRLGNLWERIVSFENLWLAYREARRGKGRRPPAMRFALNLERELLGLQAGLEEGSYQPGAYRLFTLYERKPRVIAAAPFRDRVVHHAVMNVIEPALDRRFIFDCYACRRGKGVHAAVARYQVWATRYRYALKMDIRQYFPSVDHAMPKDMLAERIKDRRALALLGAIIDTSPEVPGEPVWFPGDDLFTPLERRHGNLTSQFFANLYLDDLDHHLKDALRLPAYLRYVDDLVVLGDNKALLREIRHRVAEHLSRLRLVLHPRKAHIMPTRGGLDLLSYRVFPDRRLLRNDNGHRFARRLRAYAEGYAAGRLAWRDFDPSV